MSETAHKLPRLFGKYYLLELINVGGMAEVFKAKMFGVEGFEKIVAIKKILPEVAEDGDFIRMFIDEAKIAVQLSHPNIVQILELGKIEDSYFIAMELVNGKDLKTTRKRLKKVELLMPVEQCAYVISQVCDGLDYAHRKTDEKMAGLNIVHRDISPQNIIISYEGNVKLIDFGIAKAKSKSTKTQAGMLKGKFSYMSPEQVSGQALDRRSDIFSLGVVLFEMLTGKRLFLGKNDVETLEKIRKAEVPPPSVFNPDVNAELDQIVLRALARDREERYQWASEFGEDLKRYIFRSSKKFERQDLMRFMGEFFADELEEETTKLEEYRKLKIPKNYHENTAVRPAPSAQDEDVDDDVEIVTPAGKTFKKTATFIAAAVFIAALVVAGYFLIESQRNNATLLVDSNIFGTLVNLDEGTIYHKRCETPCKIEGILPGQHELELKKIGYIGKKETISLKQGETLSKVVQLYKAGELKTLVTVKSDPDGSRIFINDQNTGELSPAVISVPVGIDVKIRTEKEGYYPVEQNIGQLQANVTRELSFIMKPINPGAVPQKKIQEKTPQKTTQEQSQQPEEQGNMAYISVTTNPWTNVYIDEKLIQGTPIVKFPVAPGNYKLRFKNPKFNIDKVFPLELTKGQHERIIKNLY